MHAFAIHESVDGEVTQLLVAMDLMINSPVVRVVIKQIVSAPDQSQDRHFSIIVMPLKRLSLPSAPTRTCHRTIRRPEKSNDLISTTYFCYCLPIVVGQQWQASYLVALAAGYI